MDAQNTIYNRKQKKRTYLLTMEQAVSLKPQYNVYRDGMKPICTIEGDITRHRFSIRKDGTEVLRLSKKIAKLLTEYTIEKDGQVIAKIKKRISLLTHDFSGTINGQMVEICADWYACCFDILIGGRKLCEIEQKKQVLSLGVRQCQHGDLDAHLLEPQQNLLRVFVFLVYHYACFLN